MKTKPQLAVRYWYIAIWRNDEFLRTRYKPDRVGRIVGFTDRLQDSQRRGLNQKKRDFEIVNRYKFLVRGNAQELENYLEGK